MKLSNNQWLVFIVALFVVFFNYACTRSEMEAHSKNKNHDGIDGTESIASYKHAIQCAKDSLLVRMKSDSVFFLKKKSEIRTIKKKSCIIDLSFPNISIMDYDNLGISISMHNNLKTSG